jgi:predicted esterase
MSWLALFAGCNSQHACTQCGGGSTSIVLPSTAPADTAKGGAGGTVAGAGGTTAVATTVGGAGGATMSAGSGAAGTGSAGGQPSCTGSNCARDAGAADATVVDHDAGSTAPAKAPEPDPRYLVPATGPCPEFRDGYATFMPDGVERSVLLFMSNVASDKHGPLIFSWHSTLPGPETSTTWLGTDVIDAIRAQGGVVAAPSTRDPSTTRPWDNTALGPSGDNDERLMDEIVACAIDKVGIDVRRIHSIGMSAGGLKTAQVSLRRSGYIASVVVYSGGLAPDENPPDQDPNNKLAAMILYGGVTDISPVDATPYTQASTKYRDLIRSRGGFAFMCNHNGGHSVPQDSQQSAWQFMQDHPYGTVPSPYAAGLPSGFLGYCSLTQP